MKPVLAILDEAKYLKPDEAARLKRYLDDEMAAALARGSRLRLRNATLGLFLLGTGLRVSEAVAVLVEDLVLKGARRFVRVRHGKGDKSRDVTISPDLRAALLQYLEATGNDSPTTSVFPAAGSQRHMGRVSAWRVWKHQLQAVGLDADGRGCHAARHTRATLLYAATRDLRLVSRELGHADTRTTMIYADALDEDRVAAADAVDAKLAALTGQAKTSSTLPRLRR